MTITTKLKIKKVIYGKGREQGEGDRDRKKQDFFEFTVPWFL